MSTMRIKDENGDWQEVPALKGSTGDSLQFDWNGTELGVKRNIDPDYEYVDLKGEAGINSDMYKAVYDPTNEAKDVFAYDNTSSGMDATKIQTALDELSVYTPVHVNLLNPDLMIVGYIHATTGALVVSSNYKCTDFLPVVAGTVYSATNDSITRPTFYDANKVRTGIAGAFINFTIPEGSAFMRLSFRQSTTNVMLNYGATVLPFVPYSEPEYRLKTGYKRDSIIEDFITDSTVKASIDQYIKEKNGLYGLKWGALGDSQTQYGNPITSYVDYVEASTGIVGINYGVGSTTIAVRDGLTSSFYERAQLMATDLDIITVMGGINDSMGSAGPVPIGTMADRVATTFYGACHLLFVYLMETYIGKKIGVMTSIAPDSSALGLNYANVLKEVAAYYSLPLLDIWNESGINAKTETLKAQYMGDGLHPTALGREMISRRIVAFLKSL